MVLGFGGGMYTDVSLDVVMQLHIDTKIDRYDVWNISKHHAGPVITLYNLHNS